MEFYGTFKMDSIHGRLFELQVYIEGLKYHMFVYFAFVIIALLVWPIAVLLAIPVGMIAAKDIELQMFKVILVLATVVGLILWMIPTLIVSGGGGIEHFKELIYVKKELNFLDFVDFFLSELMILLVIIFSWIYHVINLDTEKYKMSAKDSWKEQRGEYGTNVSFPPTQLKRLQSVLESGKATGTGSDSGSSVTPAGEGCMAIEDVVTVLETLPGWVGKCPAVTDHLTTQMGEETGIFSDLAKLSDESQEKKIWPLDIWLTRTQFYPEEVLDLKTGLTVALQYFRDLVMMISDFVQQNYVALAVLTLLAILRTLLPRIWLWKVLDGNFWPTDIYGGGSFMVLYSSILTFCVSLLWLGLFYMIMMEYRRTECQMVIISALVDARMRVKFSQSYLMSCFWFGLDSEQSEAVLAKLPLLDLRTSSNAAAFWRLREYCTLDRCNERMAMSVLLEIVIIWLLLKFVTTLGVMMLYGGLPAILIVTLYDLLIFGGMTLFALQCALKINGMMEQHKQVFVEAKYEVTMEYGEYHHNDQDQDRDKTKKHDLDVCRHLLTEYLDMTNDSDQVARDSILFGMVVTPGKILSSLGTVAAMVATLLAKMINNGVVKPPEALEETLALAGMEKQLALAAHTTATTFLSIYRRAWHVD